MLRNCYLIIPIFLLIGCATSNTPTTWKKPNAHETPLQKLLIVSLNKDLDIRKLVEKEIVYQLRDKGYLAAASSDYLFRLSKESVIEIVDSIKADGVLVTQIKDYKREESWQKSDRYLGEPGYQYFSNYFDAVYGYSASYNTVIIETNLFTRDDQNVIFTAESESFDPQNDLEAAVADFAKSIIISLKQAKVIKAQAK